ncbi:MAG: putative rane protein [Bacteroidetes bacterium]|jgi:uncharacterized membrane protein YeaQ/YmgE (transglycosylase-associated protein family)|nr:putative rane protein [Bacteroidota bacterium]
MELGILGSIIIGILAGFIAGKMARGHSFGLVINLVVGLIGSVLGGFLFRVLDIHFGGIIGMLFVSVCGAIVFLWILTLLGGNSRQSNT